MQQFNNLTIATLGGHSALEIFYGAKKHFFKTLVIAQKGREKTYANYFRELVDELVLVDKFSEITSKDLITKLKKKAAIIIPHRYFQVYCEVNKIENDFPVAFFGNKFLLKYEEREGKYNQYNVLDEGNIPYPKRYYNPEHIESLVIIKVKEKLRSYERAFFFASNYKEFKKESELLIKSGKIKRSDLETAVIEEYLVGAQVNFNFFYSPITGRLELLGTDTRRQTNLDGLLRLPAHRQLKVGENIVPSYIESGHISVTVKESLLEKAFFLAESLLKAAKKINPKGIIGPFALQTAILPGPPQEKIVVFDISLRMPGSPGSIFTPYSQYLYDRPVSFGERIAMEIKKAQILNKIDSITT